MFRGDLPNTCEDITGSVHRNGEVCQSSNGKKGRWFCSEVKTGTLAECKPNAPSVNDTSESKKDEGLSDWGLEGPDWGYPNEDMEVDTFTPNPSDHEHCSHCPDYTCTGESERCVDSRELTGCDWTLYDRRHTCNADFECNDQSTPFIRCRQRGEIYFCRCSANGKRNTFVLNFCPGASILLEEINVHCNTTYYVQP